MDTVFKALADPTRRALLDALRERDGQTLGELEAVASMTRFGVMKHLKALEEAGLVVSRRAGRSKHHFLNAVTLVEATSRWIEPFVQGPTALGLVALRRTLEETTMTTPPAASSPDAAERRPDHVQRTWIRTTPERLWQALTTPEESPRYHFLGASLAIDPGAGGRYDHRWPDGSPMLGGEILRWEPPHLLETTFEPRWAEGVRSSRVRYEIAVQGSLCELTVLHFDLPAGLDDVVDGWARTTASLKSYLETGEGLSFATSTEEHA